LNSSELGGFLGSLLAAFVVQSILGIVAYVKTTKRLVTLTTQTNGLAKAQSDSNAALLKVTGESERAKGNLEGAAEERKNPT